MTPNTALANALIDASSSLIDGGTIQIREGTTVLVAHTIVNLVDPAVNGETATNTIVDATVLVNGTADNALFTKGSTSANLTVGIIHSGSDIIVPSLTFVAGQTSRINSLRLYTLIGN